MSESQMVRAFNIIAIVVAIIGVIFSVIVFLPEIASITVTMTPSPTNTLTSTATLSPTNTPTSTATPSPTNIPTLTNTPTSTATPIPTNTPTPTSTPRISPTLLEAPTLLGPEDNTTFGQQDEIRLQWQWTGTLSPSEVFVIRLWRVNNEPATGTVQRTLERVLDSSIISPGTYFWDIAVGNLNDDKTWTITSERTEPRKFTLLPSGPIDVTATPIPTNTPIIFSPVTATQMYTITNGDVVIEVREFPYPPASTPLDPEVQLEAPPTLLKPLDGEASASNRLDLEWEFHRNFEPNEYFFIEIWHGPELIDSVWTRDQKVYPLERGVGERHGDFYWRVTVIEGTPAGSKSRDNRYFEGLPNRLVSEPSEIWRLDVVERDETEGPSKGDDNDAGNDPGSSLP